MTLPTPTFTFNIPSIHDGIPLDCRLFAPKSNKVELPVKGAILAHPYAPLGGCFDDPIVTQIGSVLLKEGFFVYLFNFRGAQQSSGRTSWSGKPELADYVSVYGFMLHFLRCIDSCMKQLKPEMSLGPALAFIPTLILGGYSYGSMMVMHLPSVQNVMKIFKEASATSPETSIRSRATDIAKRWTKEFQRRSQTRGRARESASACGNSLAVAMGESESTSRRRSRDSRRSLDLQGLRKSMDKVRHKLSHSRTDTSCSSDEDGAPPKVEDNDFAPPIIHHLLISPLMPPLMGLLTCFSKLSFPVPQKNPNENSGLNDDSTPALSRCKTLAIYGEGDAFTPRKKFDKWAQNLASMPDSQFQASRIPNGGHFWKRSEEQRQLSEVVRAWVSPVNRITQ